MTIKEIKSQLASGEKKASEILEEHLAKIKAAESGDESVNAVITLNEEEARKKAQEIDERLKKGEQLGLLAGVPIGIKDVLCTKGLRTTAASKILDNYLPTYDATAVKNLRKEDAIIIAKTNCDEFAHGSSGENSAYGPTRNPYDLSRVAGGSSSGSGAIVAYGGAAAALGTDTGGSIRAPGSFMNLVGIKPTYGRVSRRGLISMCSSTDSVSPIAENVEEAAWMLGVMSSKDPKDSTSAGFRGKDFTVDFPKGLKGLKMAYPKQSLEEGLDDEVKKVFFEAVDLLKKEGVQIEEVSMELFGEPATAAYYVQAPSEISSNLARFDGIRYGMSEIEAQDLADLYKKTRSKYLGPEAKRRTMLGNFALSAGYYEAYYNRAQKVRRLMIEEAKRIFEQHDLIISPMMPSPAFKLGEKGDPLALYLVDVYSIYANMVGICALSVPAGWVENKEPGKALVAGEKGKLPVGLQMMGKWWDEETLLRAAYGFEQIAENKTE